MTLSRDDQKLAQLAHVALKSTPAAKPQKGTKITIVTFEDGSETRLWQHRGWGPMATLQRREKKAVKLVSHVFADDDGRGEIMKTVGTFTFDLNKLVPVA